MQVLLTNDDGHEAEGLQAMRRGAAEVPASSSPHRPRRQQLGLARMITTRRPCGAAGAPSGRHEGLRPTARGRTSPVAKLASSRARRRPRRRGESNPRLQPGRRHHRSGTGAAALEAIVSGSRASPSARSPNAERDGLPPGQRSPSSAARTSCARRRPASTRCRLPAGTLLNSNVPAGEPPGVQVTRLGKRSTATS